jgi:hypothetical protein
VANAAEILRGNGTRLNNLIHHGTDVLEELSSKRSDLARIIVQFDKVSRALATRQKAIAGLIHSYNDVAGTLVTNRVALEGTIGGLRDAALELSSLLIAHRDALHPDIENLTRTGQTLSKNVNRLAHTGRWASRLFHAAHRAVDFQKNWLRLNNHGQALEALIMMRLKQRLTQLCKDLGLPDCSQPSYWAQNVPTMFCFKDHCEAAPELPANPIDQLTEAINQVPELVNTLLEKAQKIVCDDAPNPQNCVKRKALLIKCAQAEDTRTCLEDNAVLLKCLRRTTVEGVRRCVEQHKNDDVRELVDDLLKQTLGNPHLTTPGGGGGT